jgi:hypothetical protein
MFGLKPKIGVSVTRGIKFEWGLNAMPINLTDAMNLLRKKLYGVIMSTKDVVEGDRWGQQMLHIFTPNRTSADKLQIAYDTLLVTISSFIIWHINASLFMFTHCHCHVALIGN